MDLSFLHPVFMPRYHAMAPLSQRLHRGQRRCWGSALGRVLWSQCWLCRTQVLVNNFFWVKISSWIFNYCSFEFCYCLNITICIFAWMISLRCGFDAKWSVLQPLLSCLHKDSWYQGLERSLNSDKSCAQYKLAYLCFGCILIKAESQLK